MKLEKEYFETYIQEIPITAISEDFECPVTTVKCPRSFCLPVRFICDGVIHCPDADDEKDCGIYL
jgi:hypothetical protein